MSPRSHVHVLPRQVPVLKTRPQALQHVLEQLTRDTKRLSELFIREVSVVRKVLAGPCEAVNTWLLQAHEHDHIGRSCGDGDHKLRGCGSSSNNSSVYDSSPLFSRLDGAVIGIVVGYRSFHWVRRGRRRAGLSLVKCRIFDRRIFENGGRILSRIFHFFLMSKMTYEIALIQVFDFQG